MTTPSNPFPTRKESVRTLVDPDQVQYVFQALIHMDVALDEDPVRFGPKRLNAKIASCRAYLSECESIYGKVTFHLRKYRRQHLNLSTELKMKKDHLVATDPEVKAGRAVLDREALARVRLLDLVQQIEELEEAIQELEVILTVVKAKRVDLRDIMRSIKEQIRICQEELTLGTIWGREDEPKETPLLRPMSEWVSKETLDKLEVSALDVTTSLLNKKDKKEEEEEIEEEEEEDSYPGSLLPKEERSSISTDDFVNFLESSAKLGSTQTEVSPVSSLVESEEPDPILSSEDFDLLLNNINTD